MATWVMSDLHGNYRKYRGAMDVICFQEMDTLYILGDVVDRGVGSCKILLDMSNLSYTPKNNHIAIDCGCALGAEGRLAVLCLDTMEELHF